MIVSMKPHTTGIIKVVNPVGTVVTVHSDDETVIEPPDDSVIHENCDEALFRPVVAPKPHLFIESKQQTTNKLNLKAQKRLNEKVKSETIATVNNGSQNTRRVSCKSDLIKVSQTNVENINFDHVPSKFETKNNRPQIQNSTATDVIIDSLPTKNIELPVPVAKKMKTKSKITSVSEKKTENVVITAPLHEEIPKYKADVNVKVNTAKADKAALKALITTPDLMENIDIFDFPLTKVKDNDVKDKNDTTLIIEGEYVKQDVYHDARDTEEIISDCKEEGKPKKKTFKPQKYQGLQPEEIVFPTEEEKNLNKKLRKPKTKLGVRLSKGKDSFDNTEKDSENVSLPVTTVPSKKSWSSIVSSKPIESDKNSDISKKSLSTLDFAEPDSIDNIDVELPKKSYSTVAKQHLFEIDPNEDVCDSDILQPEKVFKSNDVKSTEECNLRVDNKISDDEKQENVSSQAETTESDDSSKVIAMDTEEDSCQPDTGKSKQSLEKGIKRKPKKKKR